MQDTKTTRKAVLERLEQLGFDSMPSAVIDVLVTTAEAKAQKARDGAVTRQAVSTAFAAYARGLEKTAQGAKAAPAKATPTGTPAK
jgi:hypothetical protein